MRHFHALRTFILIFILLPSFSFAEGDKKDLKKQNENEQYVKFNINNISTYIYRNGQEDNDPDGNSGLIYPKGSGMEAVFQSGFIIGGKVNDELRIRGNAYWNCLRAGQILPNGEPEDKENPEVRVYKVKKNYKTDDFSSEINDPTNRYKDKRNYEQIYAEYEKDWNEWPADKGAPYEDINENGIYEPSIDIPGEPGADQTIWLVANGLLEGDYYFSGPALDIEIQITIWGFDSEPPIGNAIFKRYKIINKGVDTLKEAYAFHFSDPEIGDATDDLSGCDTLLSMVYSYNSDAYDNVYRYYPPALGFILYQGPVVKGNPTDIATSGNRKIQGMKNLPMTSCAYIFKGGYPIYSDPNNGEELYNYMCGLNQDGSNIMLPSRLGGGTTKFLVSGDPATGSGWVDGIEIPPADRRACMSSGPFTLAPADTQEVIYATIAAGTIDKLSYLQAVTELKKYAKAIRDNYGNFPQVKHLPKPIIETFENDQKITLDWGESQTSVSAMENYNQNEISFEGYNVYQASSLEPSKDEMVKIATYDIVDGIMRIHHPDYETDSDSLNYYVAQNGTDSGIKRSIFIDNDYINDLDLINGSKYYYAVTAYYYSKNPLTYLSVETEPVFIEVTPHIPAPGTRYGTEEGTEINVERITGSSMEQPTAFVVNPGKLTGNDYEITFTVDKLDSAFWTLTDLTAGKIKYYGPVSYNLYNPGISSDGINIKIQQLNKGINNIQRLNEHYIVWNTFSQIKLEGLHGAMGWSSPRQYFGDGKYGVSPYKLKNVLLKFAKADVDTIEYNPSFDLSDPNMSFAYRYGRNFEDPVANPEFAPYIDNPGEGFAYQDYTKSVPFSAWDVDDPNNPRRLAIAFLENNVEHGLVDGKYWPPYYLTDNSSDSSACEWAWILDEDYSETPNSHYQGNAIELDIPAMYWIISPRYNSWTYESGHVQYTIYPTRLYNENDVFRFTAPGTTYNAELAKADADAINVFPNPYYCSHSQEANAYESFVTFSHLPPKAVIKIFNLAGQLVRTIRKDNISTFQRWDLCNEEGYQAGSGLFIAHIEMPELGKSKILKFAVIQKQIIPDRY